MIRYQKDHTYGNSRYLYTSLKLCYHSRYDMWTISMHTPLGGHNCMQGKKITIQILDRKPQIIESLTPRSTEEAPARYPVPLLVYSLSNLVSLLHFYSIQFFILFLSLLFSSLLFPSVLFTSLLCFLLSYPPGSQN